MAKKRRTKKRIAKAAWTGRVKGGARVQLFPIKKGSKSVYTKAYKIKSGARRLLKITTIKRVIKGSR
jgi:hypothetical protein